MAQFKSGKPLDLIGDLMKQPFAAPMVPVLSIKRPMRTSFNEAMNDFLNTPGYNSADASAAGGHDAYMRSLRAAKVAKHSTEEDTMKEKKEVAALVSDLEKEAVQGYEEAFREKLVNFELPEPLKLTVRNGSDFNVKPFIGGEEFTPVRGYVGKRGKTIIVFKPVGVADFEEMEMTEADAKATFPGFNRYLNDALGEVMDKIQEAREEVKAQERAEEIRSKAETYAEQGFGSW